MRGLSEDIEFAIKDSLQGMELNVDISKVNDEKLSALVKSRIESFIAIKELLVSWQNSPNAPTHEKLRSYIIELVSIGNNSIEVLRKALKKGINSL